MGPWSIEYLKFKYTSNWRILPFEKKNRLLNACLLYARKLLKSLIFLGSWDLISSVRNLPLTRFSGREGGVLFLNLVIMQAWWANFGIHLSAVIQEASMAQITAEFPKSQEINKDTTKQRTKIHERFSNNWNRRSGQALHRLSFCAQQWENGRILTNARHILINTRHWFDLSGGSHCWHGIMCLSVRLSQERGSFLPASLLCPVWRIQTESRARKLPLPPSAFVSAFTPSSSGAPSRVTLHPWVLLRINFSFSVRPQSQDPLLSTLRHASFVPHCWNSTTSFRAALENARTFFFFF